MKAASTVGRYLLGAGMFAFGLNAFLQFMPAPELPELGAQFMALLFGSGYMKLIAVFKVAGGALLLSGRFVPLGLTFLGPIMVNILLFHISFDMAGIGMGLFFTVLWFLVFSSYKGSFSGLFEASPS